VTPTHRPARRATTPPISYSGLTVVLNPGHNGGDASHTAAINRQVPAGYGGYKACDTTGTNTNAGYAEHAFNFDVALRVRTILQARGVHVVLTRPNDTGVGPCVDERAAIGNRAGVAAVVSIHADGAPSAGHGFHVNQDSRRPDGASAATAARSVQLGQALHAALERSSGLVPSTYIGQDGYYYRSDLAGLNLATRPATFLELGNMRNAGDAALQSSTAGRQRIAAAIAAGILAFVGH
jgi:N-acetylmuramoyl-L-alanine amidase